MSDGSPVAPSGRVNTDGDKSRYGQIKPKSGHEFYLTERATKTWRPSTRPSAVRRDRLLDQLENIRADVPFILLVAPPGYGKTTALGQWAHSSDHLFGWVQLDEVDNDPPRLLRDISLALREMQPAAAGAGRTLVPPDGRATLARLLAFLGALDKPTVLILDDLQRIRRSAAFDLVSALVSGLPRGCHLVAAGQRRPRMRLGRLRSQGRCVELGPADLAFTPDEASELLNRVGVGLPDESVPALVRRTEGWPAGLYLAALSLARKSDPVAAAAELAGSDRYIQDYFREEVLTRQSAETVRFLLHTCVLDQMSGALCDAVLGTTGSAAWLSEIQALNLFIVPQDEEGEWYRYHRLFAETLLSELRWREPGEEFRIRRRAGHWFEQQELPEQAITYAIAGKDGMAAARLIATYAQRIYNGGRLKQVTSWLEALGETYLWHYPPLAVTAAWVWALTGDAPNAQRSLSIAESATFAGKLPDESVSLASAVARTRAALAPFGVDQMLTDAKIAVDLEPPGSPWHTSAAALYGAACLLTGNLEQAATSFERAARLGGARQRSGASFALAQQSLLAADRGDWCTAETCATESRELMEAADLCDDVIGLLSYAASARVAQHKGDTGAALSNTADALRIYRDPSPVAFPWLAAQSALVLGRLLLDLGDEPAARLKATEAGRYLAALLSEGLLREQHRQLMMDLDAARTRARSTDGASLTRAELRILNLLPTHLSLNEIAQDLVISRNTVKSQVAAIYRKLGVINRTEAVRKGHELGLIDP
jgi:LuxR family transcriptional regulator, maltose regulon positive regulatory protein